jgi:type IV secretory pathway VirB10-like protein
MTDNKIFKGVMKGLGQLGVETVEKAKEEGGKIVESIITGRELLGLDRTMSDNELAFKKQEEERKSKEEAEKLRRDMGPGRKVEEELTQLRHQEEREEEEKEKYYEREKQQRESEKQQQEMEYSGLMMQSSNPAKQKKSRGSAMAHKKKSQPDQSQMSQTQEFKGKID